MDLGSGSSADLTQGPRFSVVFPFVFLPDRLQGARTGALFCRCVPVAFYVFVRKSSRSRDHRFLEGSFRRPMRLSGRSTVQQNVSIEHSMNL